MQSNQFCLRLSVLDFCKWVFECALALFVMGGVSLLKFLNNSVGFGCGFLVFGYFEQCFNVLCLFLLFILGFRVLQSGHYFKGLAQIFPCFGGKSVGRSDGLSSKHCLDEDSVGNLKNAEQPMFDNLGETREIENENVHADDDNDDCDGFPSKHCLDEDCDLKVGLLKNAKQPILDHLGKTKQIEENENGNALFDSDDDDKVSADDCDDSCEQECYDEDEEDDVMVLREMVKSERQRANNTCSELEKERTAAATAAEETMTMILRLQNEKSLIEMQFKQFCRLAEEKQLHDQEVIQSLRWMVMKHETERGLLEDDLRCLRQKLNICDTVDEAEGMHEYFSLFNSSIEGSPGDALISSRDIDLTPLKMEI